MWHNLREFCLFSSFGKRNILPKEAIGKGKEGAILVESSKLVRWEGKTSARAASLLLLLSEKYFKSLTSRLMLDEMFVSNSRAGPSR